MPRLPFLLGLLVVVLFLAPAVHAAEAAVRRPNVLLIVADDLGWSDLGCFGSTFYETPNIDRLASRGLKLTASYVAPVCSPTRASLLTGKYPVRTGITEWIHAPKVPGPYTEKKHGYESPLINDRLALDEFTLAEAMKQGGYATFFAGKWHLGPEGFWPENQGFDINKGGFTAGHPVGAGHYFPPYGNPRLSDGPPGEQLDERLAAETVNFIDQHVNEKKDQPFFVELAFYSVHIPLMAKPNLVEKYRKKAQKLGVTESKFAKEGDVKVRLNQNHPVYAAMVETMDTAAGMVLDEIHRLNLDDNTIIIFLSDNGGVSTAEGWPTSNLPLRAGKGWVYEGGVRTPAIVVAPTITKPATVTDQPVSVTDWYPTILELTGLPQRPKQTLDGVSVVKLLQGQPFSRGPIYWHYPHFANQNNFPAGAVRDGDWKLIENYITHQSELYNLKDDIGESNDLAQQNPTKSKELQQKLDQWLKKVGARYPKKIDG